MTPEDSITPFGSILKDALNPDAPAVNNAYTQAAVLLPFITRNDMRHLIFTRRTMTVATHKGQISFPGGMMELQDLSLKDTALREAHEEIGLPAQNVEIVGYLDGMQTITDFWITPVVGVVKTPFQYALAEAEVAEIFEIPLDALMAKSAWEFGEREYNGAVYRDCRFPWKGHTIWGATGKLTWSLMTRLTTHMVESQRTVEHR